MRRFSSCMWEMVALTHSDPQNFHSSKYLVPTCMQVTPNPEIPICTETRRFNFLKEFARNHTVLPLVLHLPVPLGDRWALSTVGFDESHESMVTMSRGRCTFPSPLTRGSKIHYSPYEEAYSPKIQYRRRGK